MNQVTSGNFGLLVAYLLPGFVTLWGAAAYSPTVQNWLLIAPENVPTLGGFLYVTTASLTVGLLVSTARWAIIDRIHHATGLQAPKWDFQRLHASLQAFELLIDNHYRYYQFYSNSVIAAAIAYGAWRSTCCFGSAWSDMTFIAIECLLVLGSRDTLKKYYIRVGQLTAS